MLTTKGTHFATVPSDVSTLLLKQRGKKDHILMLPLANLLMIFTGLGAVLVKAETDVGRRGNRAC